jgi:hypothetical protein
MLSLKLEKIRLPQVNVPLAGTGCSGAIGSGRTPGNPGTFSQGGTVAAERLCGQIDTRATINSDLIMSHLSRQNVAYILSRCGIAAKFRSSQAATVRRQGCSIERHGRKPGLIGPSEGELRRWFASLAGDVERIEAKIAATPLEPRGRAAVNAGFQSFRHGQIS